MTKIKFCGLSRPCDIAAANACRPAYIGFVFAPASRRYVPPERAEVYVDAQGVQSIWWTDPVTVTETVNENVALLPFEKIQARVRDLIRYGLSWLPEDVETTVEVTQIVLANVLCREKDLQEDGLLLPCWIVRYANTDSFGVTMQTVIAVSAIDGSRVDPLQLMALAPTAS